MALNKVDVPPDGLVTWNDKPWKWQGISNIQGGQLVNQLLKHFRFLGRSDGREAHLKIRGLRASLRKRFPVQWCNLWNSPEKQVFTTDATSARALRNSKFGWREIGKQQKLKQSQSVPSPNLFQSAPEISLPRSLLRLAYRCSQNPWDCGCSPKVLRDKRAADSLADTWIPRYR